MSDSIFCSRVDIDPEGLCSFLRKNPNDLIALSDCDGGGVSNAAECDRGNNPFNKDDDNAIAGDVTLLRSCYLSSFIISGGLKLLDPRETRAEAFNNENYSIDLFRTSIDFRFAEGFMVFAIAESLTPTAFEYYAGIRQNTNFRGGMFDPALGNVKSNFTTVNGERIDVFGFFYSTEQDTQQIFISPESVGSPDTLCPVIIPRVTTGELNVCYDCTEWDELNEEVALFRPDFWIE